MTDLMEALLYYLNEACLAHYLADDPKYRISSTQTDTWSMQLPDHLDEEGQALFERYLQAAFDAHNSELGAMFQATIALCRELHSSI